MFTSQPASHSKRRQPNSFSRPQTPAQSGLHNRTPSGVSDVSANGHAQPFHDPSNTSHPSVAVPAFSTSTSTSHLTPAAERSRTSAHSIPVSYAYGAPSAAKGSPPSRNSTPRGPARRSASQAGETDDGNSIRSGASTTVTGAESGRAAEPALVRYAKIKQRNKDLGRPFENPATPGDVTREGNSTFLAGEMGQKSARPIAGRPAGKFLNGSGITDTSVNIATAFNQYLTDPEIAQNGGESAKKNQAPLESEGEESGSGKETQQVENARSLNAKKRKNRKTEDTTYKLGAEESVSESEDENRKFAQGKVKRPRIDPALGGNQEPHVREGSGTPVPTPGPSKKTTSPKRRATDATYRPEPSSSHASSDEYSEERTRRRKSKGKGRASTSGSGAIPIGRRDSDVWFGKKRKGKKGKKGSLLAGGEEEEGTSGSGEGEGEASEFIGEGGQIDMGGYEYEREDTQDGPAASYYLRAKSPSPSETSQSPFDQTTKREQSIDPTFATFDQSMNSSLGGREMSYDESGVQNSSYDYSEEERIVAAIEAQKNIAQTSSPARSQSQVNGNGRTGLVNGSPSGLRKRRNRIPSPPGLDRVAEEPVDNEELEEVNGRSEMGQSLGKTARPVIELGRKGWNKLQDPLLDWHKIGKFLGGVGVVTVLLLTYLFWPRNHSTPTYSPSRPISDYLPFSGSASKLHLYSAPVVPAGSLEALVQRLTTLEKAVGRLSTDSEVGRKAFGSLQVEVNSEKKRSMKESQNIKSTLDGFSKQFLDLNQADDRIAKIALAAIEEKLPSKLAVRMDSSGKLEIDPKFWNYLREAFAEKRELRVLAGTLDKLPARTKESEIKQPTWQDFLVENEAALRQWIDTDITSRLGQNAILSKRSFLDILRREINELKTEFETKSNENFQQIGEELLSKVAKQEEMKKASLASLINPFTRPHTASSHSGQQIIIKSTDGHNITDIISSLVDGALIKYSKDVLARPDYALGTSGGRVIPSLTSATFQAQPLGLHSKLLGWVTGASSNSGRSPATALHPYNSPGYCWPFAGAQGQLGILLSRRIIPSDITIEHVSQDVALDGLVSSAPRDFELWGIVEGREDIEKLKEWRDSEMARKRQAAEAGSAQDEESEEATSLPLTPQHLLLSTGTYDIASSSPLQTFPVASSARQLGIPVGVVVLKILSNHGEDTYTCLYRVRVGGCTASQNVESSDESEQVS